MARPDKAASVAEITEAFTSSGAAVITEYRGLTVSEMKELRRSLGGSTQYAVVKNTLTKIAAKQAGLELDELLSGPTAIAFVKGDPVEAAKGLRDFAKTHPLLVIKGGVLDAKALSADEIRRLADLESRETLLAKLAGAMNASLQQAVSLFAAPLSQAARLAAALRDKVAAEGPAETESSEAPAAEEAAAPAEAAATEAPAEEAEAPAEAAAEATTGDAEAAPAEAAAEAGTEDTAAASEPAEVPEAVADLPGPAGDVAAEPTTAPPAEEAPAPEATAEAPADAAPADEA
jgi:large subunit ribosomal protein L10